MAKITDQLITEMSGDMTNMPATKVTPSLASKTIGGILLEMNKIRPEDADRILQEQKESNLKFGDAAVKLGLVSDDELMRALSQQFDYKTLPPDSDAISQEVFVAFRLDGEEVEQYRALRSQLALRWFIEHKSLLFTSTRSGHGASNVVANLAILFSQLGHKTLLIDADIRKPSQHNLFKLSNGLGLSDLLANRTQDNVIQNIVGFENLNVLTSGTKIPNPLELLTKQNFWAEIETQYEIVLIDTPPALEYTDAQLIASEVGGGVIVARNDETKIADIEKSKDLFSIARAEVVGAVLNDF